MVDVRGCMSIEEETRAEGRGTRRVLAVADQVEPQLYNSTAAEWLGHIDLLVSCGDLPPYYLDYLMTTLDAPLLHVIGNHCEAPHDHTGDCPSSAYPGAVNLNERVVEFVGRQDLPPLLVAGVEGSPLYNKGPHQYSEQQMAWKLRRLVPGLLSNKARTGRYLDVLVTHAPPEGIHDDTDVAHRGFASLLPFIRRFKPTLLLHGHTHRYQPLMPTRTKYEDTEIINAYGHILLELTWKGKQGWKL